METNKVYQLNSHESLRLVKEDLGSIGLEYKVHPSKCEVEVEVCPYCTGNTHLKENQFKLSINYEKQIFHCHRCNAGGTYTQFRSDQRLSTGKFKSNEKSGLEIFEKIWLEAKGIDAQDVHAGAKYFDERGLTFIETDNVRFHSSAKYFEDQKVVAHCPCLVIRISDSNEKFIGIQQIFLDEDGNKAPVASPKKILGKTTDGRIILGSQSDVIAIAEGIETAMAVYLATGITTYACVSANGLRNFSLPANVTEVHIFGDNDLNGVGQGAAFEAASKIAKKKTKVFVHIPDRAKFGIIEEKSFDFLDVYNISETEMNHIVSTAEPFDVNRDAWIAPMRPEAFNGLVGRFIDRIFGATEADKNALCVQFITLFGAMVGRIPYFQVSSDRHFANLFSVIVGETSSGRKGTGLSNCKAFFNRIAPEFIKQNISDGLSTGEGVIHRLRDPVEEEVEDESSSPDSQQKKKKLKVVDKGCEDKRLLVSEPEFVQVLNASHRQGNILSSVIRKLWDCSSVSNMSKGCAQTASDPYVSVIGQITPDELRKSISSIEFSNGLGNRFLWVLSRSSKLLPLPPDLSRYDFSDLERDVLSAMNYSQRVGPIQFSPEASEIWVKNYLNRNNKFKGVLGSMTARFPAQVLRISVIYALLDKKSVIEPIHLNAAYAVWDYCQDSAAFLFGGMIENSVSRKILYNLEKSGDGLTKTEIRGLFSNHKSADQIDDALKELQSDELIDFKLESTKGRPIERWFAI